MYEEYAVGGTEGMEMNRFCWWARNANVNRNGKGNSWRGDWQGEFLKGQVRRTLLFFFLVMHVLSHSFFF